MKNKLFFTILLFGVLLSFSALVSAGLFDKFNEYADRGDKELEEYARKEAELKQQNPDYSQAKQNVAGAYDAMKEETKKKATETYYSTKNQASDMIDSAKENVASAKDKASAKFEETKDKASEKLEEVKDMASNLYESAKDKAAKAYQTTKAKTSSAKDKASDVLETAKEKAACTYENAKDKAACAYESAKDKASDVLETAKDKAAQATEATKEKAGETATAAKEKACTAWDKVKGVAYNVECAAEKAAHVTWDMVRSTLCRLYNVCSHEDTQEKTTCFFCESLTKVFEKIISDQTEKETVMNFLHLLCSLSKTNQQMCRAKVDREFDALHQRLLAQDDAHNVCHDLHLCSQ